VPWAEQADRPSLRIMSSRQTCLRKCLCGESMTASSGILCVPSDATITSSMALYSATALSCRYEVVEAAAGAPSLFGASLPPNKTGPQVTHDGHDKDFGGWRPAICISINVSSTSSRCLDPSLLPACTPLGQWPYSGRIGAQLICDIMDMIRDPSATRRC